MKASVTLKCVATGEVRVSKGNDWYRHSMFFWGRHNGNFGCDCNRHLVFERVNDPEYDDGEDGFACGYTAYEIMSIDSEDGARLVNGEPDGDAPGDPSWPECR